MKDEEELMSERMQADEKTLKAQAKVDRMGSGSIPKLMLEFGIPAILGMLCNALYSIIVAIFLGQSMGQVGLATASVVNPVMILYLSLAVLVGNGGNALAAIRLGEGKKDEAENVLGNTVTLAIIIAVLVIFISYAFDEQIVGICGGTEETWQYSKDFIHYISLGFVFQIIGLSVNNFIRTAGAPVRAMWTMAIGAGTSAILSFLFVMQFQLGIAGMSAATIIGWFASCAFVMWFFKKSGKAPFTIKLKYMYPKWHIDKMIVALGSAGFILQIAVAISAVFANNLILNYGNLSSVGVDGALSTIGITTRIVLFTVIPVIGLGIGSQPIFGYNWGARNFLRVKKTLITALGFGLIIAFITWLSIQLFSYPFSALFGVQGDMLEFVSFAMRVQCAMVLLSAFQIIGSSYFQSTGQPIKSIFLSLTRQFIYLIPLYLIMPILIPAIMEDTEQVFAAFISMPIADSFSVVTALILLIWEFRRLNRFIREKTGVGDFDTTDKGMSSQLDSGAAQDSEVLPK